MLETRLGPAAAAGRAGLARRAGAAPAARRGGGAAGRGGDRGADHQRDLLLPRRHALRAPAKALPPAGRGAARGGDPAHLVGRLLDRARRPIRSPCWRPSSGPQLGGRRVEILGTDIAEEVLARAREGVFTQFEVQRGLPVQLLVKHFRQDRRAAAAGASADALRAMARFQRFNLLDDPRGLGRFDVIFCRNVLIYFDPPTKARVLAAAGGAARARRLLLPRRRGDGARADRPAGAGAGPTRGARAAAARGPDRVAVAPEKGRAAWAGPMGIPRGITVRAQLPACRLRPGLRAMATPAPWGHASVASLLRTGMRIPDTGGPFAPKSVASGCVLRRFATHACTRQAGAPSAGDPAGWFEAAGAPSGSPTTGSSPVTRHSRARGGPIQAASGVTAGRAWRPGNCIGSRIT